MEKKRKGSRQIEKVDGRSENKKSWEGRKLKQNSGTVIKQLNAEKRLVVAHVRGRLENLRPTACRFEAVRGLEIKQPSREA